MISDRSDSPLMDSSVFENLNIEEAVDLLIRQAIELPASDLFLTCESNGVAVSVRHLGILRRMMLLSESMGNHFMNSIKARAGMGLTSQHQPLDGRWQCYLDDFVVVDLRISTIPSLYGESMAIRIPERRAELLKLHALGLRQEDHDSLVYLLNRPNGLVLVTGPTEAGKTTSSYAFLQHVNDGTRRIHTIEDPVEHSLPGVCQSQVNTKMLLDFPELLRGVLRQSPDVIKVGEIRDSITAATAVRAANSGCLVFATLHSPTAAAAVDSMLALDVHPHFLATSLLAVVAQRLVRVLCPDCKRPVDIPGISSVLDRVKDHLGTGWDGHIYEAVGCSQCRNEGYVGRTCVFEILHATKDIRRMVFEQRSISEIHQHAVDNGMLDLRSAALLKVAEGTTSIEEVVRITPGEMLLPHV